MRARDRSRGKLPIPLSCDMLRILLLVLASALLYFQLNVQPSINNPVPSAMSPTNGDHIKRIVGTLNERGQFRSLISLASTPSRQSYEGMLRDLYQDLNITKKADQKHAEAFYSIRRSKISAPYNRYRDIYAFDRTAVRVPNDLKKWIGTGRSNGHGKDIGDVEELGDEDSGYLNANVISDGKGSWWVACQVSCLDQTLGNCAHPFRRRRCQRPSILS
jgi:hypothetical protein